MALWRRWKWPWYHKLIWRTEVHQEDFAVQLAGAFGRSSSICLMSENRKGLCAHRVALGSSTEIREVDGPIKVNQRVFQHGPVDMRFKLTAAASRLEKRQVILGMPAVVEEHAPGFPCQVDGRIIMQDRLS